MPGAATLIGFTVGVTADRSAGRQSDLLSALGATVVQGPVTLRGRDLPEDLAPARRLVDLVGRGQVDAVTFTSGPAVRNFMLVADLDRRGREVLHQLNTTVLVACSGDSTGTVATEEGILQPRVTPRPTIGPLVRLVGDELVLRRQCLRMGAGELVLQGAVVLIDGRPVSLTERERAVLAKLAERPGATVSRRILLRHVWKDPSIDPGELDATVGHLRVKLGPAGAALESAVRRGYRLRAVSAQSG